MTSLTGILWCAAPGSPFQVVRKGHHAKTVANLSDFCNTGVFKKIHREPKGYRVIGLFYDNLPRIDDVVSEGKPCKFMKGPWGLWNVKFIGWVQQYKYQVTKFIPNVWWRSCVWVLLTGFAHSQSTYVALDVTEGRSQVWDGEFWGLHLSRPKERWDVDWKRV